MAARSRAAPLPGGRGRHRHRQDARLPASRRCSRGGGWSSPPPPRRCRSRSGSGTSRCCASAAASQFEAAYLKGRSNYLCLAPRRRVRARPHLRGPRGGGALAAAPGLGRADRDRRPGRARPARPLPDLEGPLRHQRHLPGPGVRRLRGVLRHPGPGPRRRGRRAAGEPPPLLRRPGHADLAGPASRCCRDYEVVIFDEAHALEEVATEYFGLQVSSWRVEELARDAAAGRGRPARPGLHAEGADRRAAPGRGALLRRGRRRALRGRAPGGAEPPRGAAARRARRRACAGPLVPAMLEPLGRRAGSGSTRRSRSCATSWPTTRRRPLAQIARRAAELRVELAAVTAMKEPSRVYFGETRGRGVFLRAAPIDVAEELVRRGSTGASTPSSSPAPPSPPRGASTTSGARSGWRRTSTSTRRVFPGPFDYATPGGAGGAGRAPRAEPARLRGRGGAAPSGSSPR